MKWLKHPTTVYLTHTSVNDALLRVCAILQMQGSYETAACMGNFVSQTLTTLQQGVIS